MVVGVQFASMVEKEGVTSMVIFGRGYGEVREYEAAPSSGYGRRESRRRVRRVAVPVVK
jgi:hypothetical protein